MKKFVGLIIHKYNTVALFSTERQLIQRPLLCILSRLEVIGGTKAGESTFPTDKHRIGIGMDDVVHKKVKNSGPQKKIK